MLLKDFVNLRFNWSRYIVVSVGTGKQLCNNNHKGKARMNKWLEHEIVGMKSFIKSKGDIALGYIEVSINEYKKV